MDFITALPLTAKGNTQIIVFVCRLTKMVHLAALPEEATALDVAKCFVHNIFRLHGLPEDMVTDRDAKFTSHFWTECMRLIGSKRSMSTSYHPRSDGQTERMNQTLEEMLRHWVGPRHDDWDCLLDCAEFAINNAVNSAIGTTPFRLNYGQDPLTPLSIELDTRLPAARSFARDMTDSLAQAKRLIQAAADRNKHYFDLKRDPQELAVGQEVLLRTTNLHFKGKMAIKLLPKWVGPFVIQERIGPLAYRLTLPPTMPVHDVFHTELLKPYKSGGREQPLPMSVEVDGEHEYKVEAILAERELKRGRRTPAIEYLVKWEGYGPEHNSWEPAENMEDTEALDIYQAQDAVKEQIRAARKNRKKTSRAPLLTPPDYR